MKFKGNDSYHVEILRLLDNDIGGDVWPSAYLF